MKRISLFLLATGVDLTRSDCLLCERGVQGLKRPDHYVDPYRTTCSKKFYDVYFHNATSANCTWEIVQNRERCCGDNEPREIEQLPTQAPVSHIEHTGSYPICDICWDETFPGNPGMVINLLDVGVGSCRQFFQVGRAGMIVTHMCDTLQYFAYEPCGCGSEASAGTDDTTPPGTLTPTVPPLPSPSFSPMTINTVEPTASPTVSPSRIPSSIPSKHMSEQPTWFPSKLPTSGPSPVPSTTPSDSPSDVHSSNPSTSPSIYPSYYPSHYPTGRPTKGPTFYPSQHPTARPTVVPTVEPTARPTVQPTTQPTARPTTSPTRAPTLKPTTASPTLRPTPRPTSPPTRNPTREPTLQPTTALPTSSPLITQREPDPDGKDGISPMGGGDDRGGAGGVRLLKGKRRIRIHI